MRIFLCYIAITSLSSLCFSQTVQFDPDPAPQGMNQCMQLNETSIAGLSSNIYSPDCIEFNNVAETNVIVPANSATFKAEAGKRIHLLPKVHMKPNTHLRIKKQFDLAWYAPNTVGVVDHLGKFEVGLNLSDDLNSEIDNFFDNNNSNGTGLNPYNRHEINIQMTFFVNDTVPVDRSDAFYYLPQKIENNDFAPDTTSFNFRIRHSPRFLGEYKGVLDIFINGTLLKQSVITFNVIPSTNAGYLEQGKYHKHMRYAKTKESFFGVGQVIPWARYPNWYDWNEAASFDVMNLEVTTPFEKLNQAGGNFSRIVSATWFLDFEAEVLGNYSPKQNHAWYFDRLADFCSEEEIYFIYCMKLHSPFELHYDDQGNLTNSNQSGWGYNPYNDDRLNSYPYASEPPIGINTVQEFYSDAGAKDNYKNYIRYIISRWGYASSIAGWQLMSEIDNTADYRDNFNTRVDVAFWTEEMLKFIANEQYDRHTRSVSAMGNPDAAYSSLENMTPYASAYCNFAGIHQYTIQDIVSDPSIPVYGNYRNRNVLSTYEAASNVSTGSNGNTDDIVHNWNTRTNLMIFDEHGVAGNLYEPVVPNPLAQDVTGYMNRCQQNSFHNDLWATICSGAAISGLEWTLAEDPIRQAQWFLEFPHLQTFFSTIDFESKNYSSVKHHNAGGNYIASRWPWLHDDIKLTNVGTVADPIANPQSYNEENTLEAIALVSEDKTQGFGWCHNRSYYWWNLQNDPYSCIGAMIDPTVDPNDIWEIQHLFQPIDDDLVSVPVGNGAGDAYFKVRDLAGGQDYEIRFFDTRTGTWIHSQDKNADLNGTLKIWSPDMSYYPDLAFTIRRKGYTWKSLSPDSLAMNEPNEDELLITRNLLSDYDITLLGHISNNGNFIIKSTKDMIERIDVSSISGDLIDQISNINTLTFNYESSLTNGTYLVNVATKETEKTFKIIVSE